MTRRTLLAIVAVACVAAAAGAGLAEKKEEAMSEKLQKSDAEWRKELSEEEYRVLRKKGTERAFSGDLWNNKEQGVYRCAGCGSELFSSTTKFDSGTGWPSFFEPVEPRQVETETDRGLFMTRTEVHCAHCGGHLGHVFEDGPKPTGLRYCINSVSLDFEKATTATGSEE